MQAPPPPMMRGPATNLQKMIAVLGIVLGLLLMAAGAIMADLSQAEVPGETPDQQTLRLNWATAYGPAIAHFGMFLFVGGLIWAALFVELADPFLRLFMLILAFLALLLVLANSTALFGF